MTFRHIIVLIFQKTKHVIYYSRVINLKLRLKYIGIYIFFKGKIDKNALDLVAFYILRKGLDTVESLTAGAA